MTYHFESSTSGGYHAVVGMPDGHIFIRDIAADEKDAWGVILNDLLNAQADARGGSVDAAMSWFEEQGFTKASFENRPAIMSSIPAEVAERLELDCQALAVGISLDVTDDGTPLEALTISKLREIIEAHGGKAEGLVKKAEFVDAARLAIESFSAQTQPETPSEEAPASETVPATEPSQTRVIGVDYADGGETAPNAENSQPATPVETQPETPSEEAKTETAEADKDAKPKRSN